MAIVILLKKEKKKERKMIPQNYTTKQMFCGEESIN
jgi:hypothetical protein